MKQHYTDIVHREHPTSRTHPPMPRQNRAAQFAPFAALVGHDAAIAEAARLTERRRELDEGELEVLDRRLRWLTEHLDEQPSAAVTWFQADARKSGGAYHTVSGIAQAVTAEALWVAGHRIPLSDIVNIACGEENN